MEKILDKLGFSEYKKKAYIALIRLEKASAGEIAKKSKIPTSKVYEILHWLYENGYISIVSQKPLVYKANDPKSLLKSQVKDRISELKDIEQEINNIKTNLGVAEEGNFQIVYGKAAFFKKVKEATQKSKNNIIAIVKNFKLDYELRELTKDAIEKGAKARFLGPTNLNKEAIAEWKKTGVKIKNFIPDSTRFTVWDKKIITIGLKDQGRKDYVSLWMENEYLGKILTDYFDRIWKGKT